MRSTGRRLIRWTRWGVTVLFCAAVVSWILSFIYPHGVEWRGRRGYGVFCQRGTVQFSVETVTELNFSARAFGARPFRVGVNGGSVVTAQPPTTRDESLVREVGLPHDETHPRGLHLFAARQMPIVLSPWEPFQRASLLIGGSVGAVEFGHKTQIYAVPHWLLALVLSIWPAWWLVAWRRRREQRRRSRGLCVQCGYDLRATPGRCPECGAVQVTLAQ